MVKYKNVKPAGIDCVPIFIPGRLKSISEV